MKCHKKDENHICLLDDNCGHLYFFLRKDQDFVEDFYDVPSGCRFIDLSEFTKYSTDGVLRYDYINRSVDDINKLPF